MFGFKLFGFIWNGLVEIIMIKGVLELVSIVWFGSMWYVIVWLFWLRLVWFGYCLVVMYVKFGVVNALFDL